MWARRVYCSDIWAIGCLIFEMRSSSPLFSLAIQNPPLEALSQINGALGELPPDHKIVQLNEEGYLERNGCENPVDLSSAVNGLPLDVLVKKIKAARISLPTIDIPLGREKPSRKPWKMEPLSSEFRPHIKNNPNIFWKPFRSSRGARIDEAEQSDRQMDLEDAMSNRVTPLSKISAEESASLTDLLSKILRYEPQERISLDDLAQHAWLAAPVESKP